MRLTPLAVGMAFGLGAYCLGREVIRRRRWFDYAGKVVLVTGGSRGLGLVLARNLVDAGARVAILARTADDIASAVDELWARAAELQSGAEVRGLVANVQNQAEVEAAVAEIIRTWGGIDVLINAAGIMQVGPLDTMQMADFREAMETNCWGALHTVLAVLPTMRKARWGRIVNVASIGGKRAVPHMLPYDTSKFALVGLSNGLRAELRKAGILVTTACPSLMRTGSPRNALFKGQHRKEYAWFSIGGSLPLVSMSAERAAAQILQACQHGEGEVYISNPLSPVTLASQYLPGWTTELQGLVNFWLPEPGGIGNEARRGYESTSWISPSLLTTLGDQAAERNNEMRRRPSRDHQSDGWN
jgi:NAD(P)-dependent dehydrogenase (short-subunit alcohol dehydrogenase family)